MAACSTKAKKATVAYLLPTRRAVSELLRIAATSALTDSLTICVWSAELRLSIQGITWPFVDDSWGFHFILLTKLTTGTSKRTAEQLCSILDCVLKHSTIIEFDKTSIHKGADVDNAYTFGLMDIPIMM